jgi:hypothetical protein
VYMLKNLTPIFSYLLFFCLVSKITCSETVAVSGYFVNNYKDTVKVEFKVPVNDSGIVDVEKLLCDVGYNDKSHIEGILNVDMVLEICFVYKGEVFRFSSIANNIAHDHRSDCGYSSVFLRSMLKGKVSILMYYGKYGSGTADRWVYPGTRYYGQPIFMKGTQTLLVPESGFRKKISSYFSDSPQLAQKIKQKVYKREDLVAIVEEYNSNCK